MDAKQRKNQKNQAMSLNLRNLRWYEFFGLEQASFSDSLLARMRPLRKILAKRLEILQSLPLKSHGKELPRHSNYRTNLEQQPPLSELHKVEKM